MIPPRCSLRCHEALIVVGGLNAVPPAQPHKVQGEEKRAHQLKARRPKEVEGLGAHAERRNTNGPVIPAESPLARWQSSWEWRRSPSAGRPMRRRRLPQVELDSDPERREVVEGRERLEWEDLESSPQRRSSSPCTSPWSRWHRGRQSGRVARSGRRAVITVALGPRDISARHVLGVLCALGANALAPEGLRIAVGCGRRRVATDVPRLRACADFRTRLRPLIETLGSRREAGLLSLPRLEAAPHTVLLPPSPPNGGQRRRAGLGRSIGGRPARRRSSRRPFGVSERSRSTRCRASERLAALQQEPAPPPAAPPPAAAPPPPSAPHPRPRSPAARRRHCADIGGCCAGLTHYGDVAGVPHAFESDVKRAYHKLSLRIHPDKSTHPAPPRPSSWCRPRLRCCRSGAAGCIRRQGLRAGLRAPRAAAAGSRRRPGRPARGRAAFLAGAGDQGRLRAAPAAREQGRVQGSAREPGGAARASAPSAGGGGRLKQLLDAALRQSRAEEQRFEAANMCRLAEHTTAWNVEAELQQIFRAAVAAGVDAGTIAKVQARSSCSRAAMTSSASATRSACGARPSSRPPSRPRRRRQQQAQRPRRSRRRQAAAQQAAAQAAAQQRHRRPPRRRSTSVRGGTASSDTAGGGAALGGGAGGRQQQAKQRAAAEWIAAQQQAQQQAADARRPRPRRTAWRRWRGRSRRKAAAARQAAEALAAQQAAQQAAERAAAAQRRRRRRGRGGEAAARKRPWSAREALRTGGGATRQGRGGSRGPASAAAAAAAALPAASSRRPARRHKRSGEENATPQVGGAAAGNKLPSRNQAGRQEARLQQGDQGGRQDAARGLKQTGLASFFASSRRRCLCLGPSSNTGVDTCVFLRSVGYSLPCTERFMKS